MKWVLIVMVVVVAMFFILQKSPLPPQISVGQRKSMVGAGKVVVLRNDSAEHYYNVRVSVRSVRDPLRKAACMADDHMLPGEMVEVGWMELGRWVIEPGEVVTVTTESNPIPVIYEVR
jgi:hypothetical protein